MSSKRTCACHTVAESHLQVSDGARGEHEKSTFMAAFLEGLKLRSCGFDEQLCLPQLDHSIALPRVGAPFGPDQHGNRSSQGHFFAEAPMLVPS